MRRIRLVLGLLILGAAFGVAHAVLTTTQDEEIAPQVEPAGTPVLEAAPTAADPSAETLTCEPEEEVMTLAASSCARCPLEQPRCSRNRDCDSVCGGKGTGVCEQINSCLKCCTCAGTT